MIVAFIDILGTRNRSIEDTEKIYVMFQKFITRNEERQKNFPKSYSRKCWFFSDCAYLVYYQNGKSEEVSNLEVLRPMLINLSIEMIKFWDEGFLVRGGIAMGESCFHTDKDIFCGEAFNVASSFDKKDMPPAIFLSPELANEFGRIYRDGEQIKRNNTPPELQFVLDFPEYILKDGDNYFLNALWYLENSLISVGVDDRSVHPAQFVKKIGIHCEEEMLLANARGDTSVEKKWNWMRNYLYQRLCPFDKYESVGLYDLWYQCATDDDRTMLIEIYDKVIPSPPNFNN